METLLSVAARELVKVLGVSEVSPQASHLGQLLCSLQTALLCWCHQQMSTDNKDHANIAQDVLVRCELLSFQGIFVSIQGELSFSILGKS